MDKELIERLVDAYEAKRMAFENHQCRNVYGVPQAELTKMAREYHIAEAEMNEAWAKLETAKRAA